MHILNLDECDNIIKYNRNISDFVDNIKLPDYVYGKFINNKDNILKYLHMCSNNTELLNIWNVDHSTLSAIYSLYLAIIMNKNSLIIQNKAFACEEIILLIKFIYKKLPNTIGSCNISEIVSSNKRFIRFKNGCYILAYSPTQSSNDIRGFYLNTIIVNNIQKFNINSLYDVFEFIELYKNNQQCILHSNAISIEILFKYKNFYTTIVDDVY
jgi:hypothetical protein